MLLSARNQSSISGMSPPTSGYKIIRVFSNFVSLWLNSYLRVKSLNFFWRLCRHWVYFSVNSTMISHTPSWYHKKFTPKWLETDQNWHFLLYLLCLFMYIILQVDEKYWLICRSYKVIQSLCPRVRLTKYIRVRKSILLSFSYPVLLSFFAP